MPGSREPIRLLAAICALLLAGAAQITATLLGAPQLGVLVVAPVLLAVPVLARPSWKVWLLFGTYLAIEMVIPLHTGGGRIGDWDRHYQLARAYVDLPSTYVAEVRQRTPLFNALIGSVLVHAQPFWVFQLMSVGLNALWLWPARLIAGMRGTPPARLVVVGLTPIVVLFSVYTWPWGFCSFFILSALYFVLQAGGRMAAAGAGIAAAGALCVHIGAIGYVTGLLLFIVLRGPRRLITFVAAAAASCTIIPWVIFVTRSESLGALLSGSAVAQYSGGWRDWMLSRPTVLAATFWGIPPVDLSVRLLDVVISLFFFSAVAALLPIALMIRRRVLDVPRPAVWMGGGAIVAGLLLLPANTSRSGLAETVFTGYLALLTFGVTHLSEMQYRRLLRVTAGLAAVVTVALVWRSTVSLPGDPNVTIKTSEQLVFFVDRFTWIPGAVLAVVLVCFAVLRARRPVTRAFGST